MRPLPVRLERTGSHVEMRGIVKRFGSLVANDEIDLDLRPGEIHAIVGQNGAGKTTLMRILFGMMRPDAGAILVDGTPVVMRSPREALAHKIGMVHQHFLLVSTFTIAQNVVLGSKTHKGLGLDRSAKDPLVLQLAQDIGFDVDVGTVIANLPIDMQQRVEILKLLYNGATTLILDEPTSSLGPNQIRGLFATLSDLRERGSSVVIVTHKLSEVVELADRVTVIRQGKVVATTPRGAFDEHALAVSMLGAELPDIDARQRLEGRENSEVLRLADVAVQGDRGELAIDGLDLSARSGQILGIAGVEGNGQRELGELLAGLRAPQRGTIQIHGAAAGAWNPSRLRRLGVGVCTEDRHRWDLFLDLPLADNLASVDVAVGKYKGMRFLPGAAIMASAKRLLKQFRIEPSDAKLSVSRLSGGNQQKLILARELAQDPTLLVAAQPTRGLDVGSSHFVHEQLVRLREEGCCIVLISNDLDELMKLSDRIVVLFRGRVNYAADIESVSWERLARAMAGLEMRAAAS